MFRTFAQFPEGQRGMKEAFGNSGGEGGGVVFLPGPAQREGLGGL